MKWSTQIRKGKTSLSQAERAKHNSRNERTNLTPQQKKLNKEEDPNQPETFAHASEGSDAELKCEMKWCGVPHWESQPKCTNELIGQALVEHESPEMPL